MSIESDIDHIEEQLRTPCCIEAMDRVREAIDNSSVDAIAFAEWYGQRTYESGGDCGHPATMYEEWKHMREQQE